MATTSLFHLAFCLEAITNGSLKLGI